MYLAYNQITVKLHSHAPNVRKIRSYESLTIYNTTVHNTHMRLTRPLEIEARSREQLWAMAARYRSGLWSTGRDCELAIEARAGAVSFFCKAIYSTNIL